MSRKLLMSIIAVLIITNGVTLYFWNKDEAVDPVDESVTLEDDEQTEVTGESVVAKIAGEEISYDAWIETLRKSHGQRQLQAMIDRSVVKQLATKGNITISEKVIDRDISFLSTMKGVMTETERERQEASWREDIIYRYQLEALLTQDIQIDAAESKAYYEEYDAQYDFSPSIQSSHIVVNTFETAEKVYQELEQGASFDLLAQEYSIDTETKDDGGYLGFLLEDSQFYPPGYKEVAHTLADGTYSEPFKAHNGVAILYLHRKLPEIAFTYEEIKPYLESELALKESNQLLTAKPLWEQLEIEWLYEAE